MIGASTLAITVSSKSKTNTIADEYSKQATAVAEAGVTKYLDLLSRYPQLSLYCNVSNESIPSCKTGKTTWATATAENLSVDTNSSICISDSHSSLAPPPLTTPEITEIHNQASQHWQTFTEQSSIALVSYIYKPDLGIPENTAPGTGILTIDGRTSPNSGGISRIEISFPIISHADTQECIIPGIWANGSMKVSPHSNGSINAVVKKTDTTIPSTTDINPFGTDFPSNSLHGSSIYDGTTPPSHGTINATMPTIPHTIPSPSYTIFSVGNAINGYLDLSSCTIRLPRKIGQNSWGSGCPTSITSTFNNITVADVPSADNRYHYLIPSDDTNGGDSLKLSNAAIRIEPEEGKKVVLYLRGNIIMSGTEDNGNDIILATSSNRDSMPTDQTGLGCELTADASTTAITTFINQGSAKNLEMYGGNGGNSSTWSSGHISNIVDLSANTRINGFMLFPQAEVKVSQGLLSGSVWAKDFDFSNTSGCTVGVIQNAVGSILASSNSYPSLPSMGNINSWQRVPR